MCVPSPCSLLLNTVGFYQITKLLLAPFVCIVESLFFGKRFSIPVLLCILATLIGVGIVTVSDVDANPLGLAMAVVFIVTSGLQQILCGHFQAKFNIASHQLLANTSPVQGAMLLAVGPYLDLMVTGKWIGKWEINVPALEVRTRTWHVRGGRGCGVLPTGDGPGRQAAWNSLASINHLPPSPTCPSFPSCAGSWDVLRRCNSGEPEPVPVPGPLLRDQLPGAGPRQDHPCALRGVGDLQRGHQRAATLRYDLNLLQRLAGG